MSDDGWGDDPDNNEMMTAYQRIDLELEERPVTKEIVEKDAPKELPRLVTNGSDVVYLPDYDSDDDDEYLGANRKPTYFRPPLQVQRNQFVRNTLMRFKNDIFKTDFHKMAVMGCGEFSLERFLIHELSKFGIQRVVSVDIDVDPLAKGKRIMTEHLERMANSIKGFNRFPVLLEYYYGDILKYDPRLAETDVVCSTEVIEHISEAEAEVFVRNVLGNVRPRLFILSTPNHEYNEAFGMEPGVFRHDDHKYEFTREQFKEWMQRIVADFPEYQHSIHLVGNMPGFYHFGGATQFAAIWSTGNDLTKVTEACPESYQKVGYHVAYGGFTQLLLDRGRPALLQYLREHEEDFVPNNLSKTKYAQFWKIYLDDLFAVMDLPKVVRSETKEDRILKMFCALTKNRLYSKFCDVGDEEDRSHLILPYDQKISGILDSLS